MELKLKISDVRERREFIEEMSIWEDELLTMTPTKLWGHYEKMLNRMDEAEKFYKGGSGILNTNTNN